MNQLSHLHSSISSKVACPICLGQLTEQDGLLCSCGASYPVIEDIPVFLVEDEHVRIKQDEIAGEVIYNRTVIPEHVHEARRELVDSNAMEFLSGTGVDVAGKETLVIGCTMFEMLFWTGLGARPVGLDIGPQLTIACARASRTDHNLDVGWLCGDGECLPFQDNSFDVVIVRQSLHHMVKYRAAVAEFLRVARDLVLLIDEPYAPGSADSVTDCTRNYRSGDTPEEMLADKYHDFSLPACLAALGRLGAAYLLHWPQRIGRVTENGCVRFHSGINPNLGVPPMDRLALGGNASIAVRKVGAPPRRPRNGLRPLATEAVMAML